MAIPGINGISSNNYFFCGVLDGSNVEPVYAKSDQAAKPVSPVAGPPQALSPEVKRWQMIDSAVMIFSKEGFYATGDGKIRIETFSAAASDPSIDQNGLASVLDITNTSSYYKLPGITFFGKVAADGVFIVNEDSLSEENGYTLILVSDAVPREFLPLGYVLSHEIKHAIDYLSGDVTRFYKEIGLAVSSSSGSAAEGDIFEGRFLMLTVEIRARMFQLDWYLSHMAMVSPQGRPSAEYLLSDHVNEISRYFGYRNCMFEANLNNEAGLGLDGSTMLFNQYVDSLFEKMVPFSGVEELNGRLAPFKYAIDPDRQNTPSENAQIEKHLDMKL